MNIKYLWDGTSADWALCHVNFEDKDELARYSIVNLSSRRILLIEDKVIYQCAKLKMMEAGIKILTPAQLKAALNDQDEK